MDTHILYPTLYTPAAGRQQSLERLMRLASGLIPHLHRLAICTEDAVASTDIPEALRNLRALLERLDPESPVAIFIRTRNEEVLARLLDMPHIERVRGFVLPKASPKSVWKYMDPVIERSQALRFMPILEHPFMTDAGFRAELRTQLADPRYREYIDCLRIGANDLLGHQGLRRDDKEFTIHDIMGTFIDLIVTEFRGCSGLPITAPVFECFGAEYDELFRREVRLNIAKGLFGQTVIHPRHLPLLMALYKVRRRDLESAAAILQSSAAVTNGGGRMDEKATHHKWATLTLQRAKLFGQS